MTDLPSTPPNAGFFPPTRRSAIAEVGSRDPATRARAFERLVRIYWRPVYKHVRLRWNRSEDDARDLTQGFFARTFEKHHLEDYDPAKARFRTYLKVCLDRFVLEDARANARQKRGGNAVRLGLDFEGAEEEIARAAAVDPTTIFDDAWKQSLLAGAVDALERACRTTNKKVPFEVFRLYVLDGGNADERPSYASVASKLGLSVTDVTNHLSWARRRFREVLLEELRALTATDEEFREEAQAVFGFEP